MQIAVDSLRQRLRGRCHQQERAEVRQSAIANGATAAFTTLQSFMNPVALATDTLGDVFVADAATGIITEIATGTSKTLSAVFVAPAGLAVDFLNNLYVLDSGAKTITRIGSNLTAWHHRQHRAYGADGSYRGRQRQPVRHGHR